MPLTQQQYDAWLLKGFDSLIKFMEDNPYKFDEHSRQLLLTAIEQLNVIMTIRERPTTTNLDKILPATLFALTDLLTQRYMDTTTASFERHQLIRIRAARIKLIQILKAGAP